MSRRSNQNNQYNGNQYNGNQYNGNQYYGNNGQYYNQNGQYYNQNGQYYNQNGQYYNQNGQYYGRNQMPNQKQPKSNKFGILGPQNQQTNQNEKKNNNGLYIKVGIFVVFAIILLLIVFAINSCDKKAEPICGEDYRQVGTEKYGYYCIPSDWVNFEDEQGSRGIQFSDINGEYILTLDAVITTEISAQEYALATANSLQNAGIAVQGSEVELDKYKAYQVYGQTDSGIWVLVYFFEADDGYSHYVGIEGPDRNNEAFKIVESFTTEKEEY